MKKTYIAPNTILVDTYGEQIMGTIGSVQLKKDSETVEIGKIFDDTIDEAGAKGGSFWNDDDAI